jgi:hypothetical protein
MWPANIVCGGAESNAKNRVSLRGRDMPEIGNHGGGGFIQMS